jgi:hypothetical protein
VLIRLDDLHGPEIATFLEEHLEDMRAVSPPESKHALDLDGLRKPEITFWTVWGGRVVVGENQSFLGEERWLASHGVAIEVVQDQRCIELMRDFVQSRPSLWAEDIGE